MAKTWRFPIALSLGLFGILISTQKIGAQDNLSMAVEFSIPDGVLPGSILCSQEGGEVFACDEEYSPRMMGFVISNPSIGLESEGGGQTFLVTSGRAIVRATDSQGDIVPGDFVTASSEPGKVAKATKNGYISGVALSEYEDVGGGEGQVEVVVGIRLQSGFSNARSNLIEYLRQGIESPIFEPLSSFRYVLAALLVLLAFTFGMLFFGRMARTGVEAVGRNPLASRMIQIQVLVNILVLLLVVAAGVFAAYLILIL